MHIKPRGALHAPWFDRQVPFLQGRLGFGSEAGGHVLNTHVAVISHTVRSHGWGYVFSDSGTHGAMLWEIKRVVQLVTGGDVRERADAHLVIAGDTAT